MTMIEKITAQEFEDTTNYHKKISVYAQVLQEELRILMDLQDGEAIKFPCKPGFGTELGIPDEDWKYHGTACRWIRRITQEAKKHGVRVKAKCVRTMPKGPWLPNETLRSIEASGGGTMYVLRVGSKNTESSN